MAVKFSQFDGTVVPSKTSTTQHIVGFEGTTNIKWTLQEIADEIGGSGGDTIFTTNPTSTIPSSQEITLTDSIEFKDGLLSVKGAGLTSGTTAFAVKDSGDSDIFNVTDDGEVKIESNLNNYTGFRIKAANGSTGTDAIACLLYTSDAADEP